MDRTAFTGVMVSVDDMTDTQLSVLYAYVRDTKANRATEKAAARRRLQNAPQSPGDNASGALVETSAGDDSASVRGVSDTDDKRARRAVGAA
jgi:hypothetical protein